MSPFAQDKFNRLFGLTVVLYVAMMFSTLALHHARRWHPDEAFYMTIARNAAIHGDWMLVSEPLDKPPLTYYTNALALVFLAIESDENGVLFLDIYRGEFAGRISSIFMSVILVAVIIAMTKSVWRDDWCIAAIAGLLAALSPLRIVFAATAFTDMPMLLFATLSLWMAIRGKWAWSGVWFMMSMAAKPQSIFYLPLLVGIGILQMRKHSKPKRAFMHLVVAVAGGLTVLWIWDAVRVDMGASSFWQLGQAYYTPTTLTPLADYPTRICTLWETVQYLFGHGFVTAFLLIMGVISTLWRRDSLGLVLLAWLIGFFVLHIAFTLNLFDRNLLLILPIACVLMGKTLSEVTLHLCDSNMTHRYFSIFAIQVGLILVLVAFSFMAATGAYNIGGDDGRHDGIDELADYLNSKPIATVIYDRWLDWELDYYMGEWTNKRRVYYPTPQQLVHDALQLEESGIRYFVAPTMQNVSDWLTVLSPSGFEITIDYEFDNFRVYAVQPP